MGDTMWKSWAYLAALTLLALGGLALPQWAVFTLTLALAKGLVVLGLMVLWRAGLVSFGQALYYCLGGYTVGMCGRYLGWSDAIGLVALGTWVAFAVSFLLGFIISRYREIFFAMLSLAFSMILYGVLVKSEVLGSTDGFNVITPTLLGWAPQDQAIPLADFYLTLVAVVLGGAAVRIYLHSTMGHLATAIRDNEVRVEYLGVSARALIHAKYVLAAALAGAGGALSALAVGHVDPEMAYWTTSGEFVFVTILSGTGNIAAPFVGSTLFELVRTYAFQYSPYTWQMVLGATLLLLILFLPEGIWSLVQRRRPARGTGG
jgi:branched-chain amino acid transport system permease protein